MAKATPTVTGKGKGKAKKVSQASSNTALFEVMMFFKQENQILMNKVEALEKRINIMTERRNYLSSTLQTLNARMSVVEARADNADQVIATMLGLGEPTILNAYHDAVDQVYGVPGTPGAETVLEQESDEESVDLLEDLFRD